MSQGLKRELGLLDVFCISTGAMISSGLFILPGLAFAKAGPSVIFSYVIASILILPTLLSKAELATAMPRAGGTYFFIERSMGALFGTIGGLASWFSLSLKSAFALIGIGVFATLVEPSMDEMSVRLVATGFCLFFMIVNILGVKLTGRLQITLVLFLLGILAYYVIHGFQFIKPERYLPFAPYGIGSVFATAGLVFVSFGGLTKVCCVAEEIKNPGRNIPLGMLLAYVVVTFFYAAAVFITIGLLEAGALASSRIPISLGASVFADRLGRLLLGFAAFLAFITTANAGILTASRDSMAMSRDYLVPRFLQRISMKFKTPHISIIITTAFMISVILFLSFENLVKTASTLMIILFMFENAALIVMRESKIQGYRPQFHSPLYPWVQIIAVIGYGFLLFEMGRIPLLITGSFIACGATWYALYGRTRVSRQAALVHIIERITAGDLTESTLPDELKDIIIERDEIVEDRFDKLINECNIIDLEKSVTMEEFFRRASTLIAGKMKKEENVIYDLLLKREKESSTVIRPGLAIPHIIVEGKKEFRILLARCKEGIVFPGVDPKVHVVFVLVGSKDERNFHLRALAAIAEIAQGRDFDKRWLAARNSEELRHIVLLAERNRFLGK